jgi:heme/copper-type cytochrome/quinol oxidase subunit 4
LYVLNDWLFDRLAFSEHVSWIFLPAALRMIAVLLAGWVGALGIFLGSLATCIYFLGTSDPSYVVVIAVISALAPTAALLVCARFWGPQLNLTGLSATHLLALSTVAAGFTAIIHNAYFMMLGKVDAVASSMGAMFVGDLIGTLIVLYGAKWVLHALVPKSATGAA